MINMCSSSWSSSTYAPVTIPLTTDFQFTFRAPMHEIRWKGSDKTEEATRRQSATETSNVNRSHSSTHLSTGATAAIGVCVPLAILAFIGIAAFLLRRRMKQSRQSAQVELVATQGTTLPEVFVEGEQGGHPEKFESLRSPRSPLEPYLATTEAAPRYEAEGTDSFRQDIEGRSPALDGFQASSMG